MRTVSAHRGNANATNTVIIALIDAKPTPSQSPQVLRWRMSTPSRIWAYAAQKVVHTRDHRHHAREGDPAERFVTFSATTVSFGNTNGLALRLYGCARTTGATLHGKLRRR